MELSKKDKKIARILIDKGLQRELKNGMNTFASILENWKTNHTNTHECYRLLYKEIHDFNKGIAQRYDGLGGSQYFFTVYLLLKEGVLNEDELSELSEEVKTRIKLVYNL